MNHIVDSTYAGTGSPCPAIPYINGARNPLISTPGETCSSRYVSQSAWRRPAGYRTTSPILLHQAGTITLKHAGKRCRRTRSSMTSLVRTHRSANIATRPLPRPPNGSLRLHIVGNPVRIRTRRRAAWLRPMNHCRHKRWQADERTHWRIG